MIQAVHGPHFEKPYFKSPKCLGKSDSSLAISPLRLPPALHVAVKIIPYHTTYLYSGL